jgi:hypothetical protein
MQRIYNLASVSDDHVLLTTRQGFNTAEHPWLRFTREQALPEELEAAEQTAILTDARGVIANSVLNPAIRSRAGWQPWTENDDLTAVYETPIGLLIRLGVEGRDPRSGLDPVQFMAPALALVQQLTASAREEPRGEQAIVLPGACGGGKWHVHNETTIRFTKLILNEIPYLADVIALALQFAASALDYERVEIPGDCVLYANVTSRRGIFEETASAEDEDRIATEENQYRALQPIQWPPEGGPLKFRAPLMKAARAARLELVRFSRPESRPTLTKLLRGTTPQLLPSIYSNLAYAADYPHPLARFTPQTRLRVAAFWDLLWRETLHPAEPREGDRAPSIDSHLHVPYGRDSRIHVHDVTNLLDQRDRGRLRDPATRSVPTRVLEITDYRHPLMDSQPAARLEIIGEIVTMINVVEAAQRVMHGLAVLFTLPLIQTWRRVAIARASEAVPRKLQAIDASTSLWRV